MFEQRFDHICAEHAEAMEAIEQRVREVVAGRNRQDAEASRARPVARALAPQVGFGSADEARTRPDAAVPDAAVPDTSVPAAPVPRPEGSTPSAPAADADGPVCDGERIEQDADVYRLVRRCGPAAAGADLLDPRWNRHLRPPPA